MSQPVMMYCANQMLATKFTRATAMLPRFTHVTLLTYPAAATDTPGPQTANSGPAPGGGAPKSWISRSHWPVPEAQAGVFGMGLSGTRPETHPNQRGRGSTVPPMEPIPETVEAVDELDPSVDDFDILQHLTELANRAQEIVPDLVGVSVGRMAEGLTFTLVATAAEISVLDGIQYLAGGPCVEGAQSRETREFNRDDVMDEEAWRLFAEATAVTAVHSTLTLPVVTGDEVVGTVNLYAASERAFEGHHDELAEVFGAWAAGAIANADLSFTTREEAQAAPQRVQEQHFIDVATGILAARLGVDVDTASARLHDAAVRAGVALVELARSIVESLERRTREES
jgi:ANTAR domain